MSNKQKKRIRMNPVHIIMALLICILIISIGAAIHAHQAEQARIEALTPDERQKEEAEALAEQERAEAKKREVQKQKEEFQQDMESYNTAHIRYKSGVRGQHAVFELSDIGRGLTIVYGEDLPAGSQASYQMNGRGEAGFGRYGNRARWQRAGQYGIYYYTSHRSPNVKQGDHAQFKHLQTVEIRVWF